MGRFAVQDSAIVGPKEVSMTVGTKGQETSASETKKTQHVSEEQRQKTGGYMLNVDPNMEM